MAKIKSYIHIALLLCIGLALGSCTKWNYLFHVGLFQKTAP